MPTEAGWRVSAPLESGGVPVVLAVERPDHGRTVATAFTVSDSDFPLRVGFPLFVSNVVHWLAGRSGGGADALTAGQTYVPAENEKIEKHPREKAGELANEAPSLTEEPVRLKKNGFYEVRTADSERVRWLAVNTASREESDLREAKSNRLAVAWSLGWGGLHPRQWLAPAAFVLMVAEWFLHHRRITE